MINKIIFILALTVIFIGCKHKCDLQPIPVREEMDVDTLNNRIYYSYNSENYIIYKTYAPTGIITKYHSLYFSYSPFFVCKFADEYDNSLITDVYALAIDSNCYEKLEITFSQNRVIHTNKIKLEFTSNYLGKIFNADTVSLNSRGLCNIIQKWNITSLP